MASPALPQQQVANDMARRNNQPAANNSPNPAKRGAASISTSQKDPRYSILQIHFSDGTAQWQDGENGPTPDMMDQTPDENGVQSYMRQVNRWEKKEIEWLRILAEGIVSSSEDPAIKEDLKNGKRFFFYSLPDGYRLFEQIRIQPVCPLTFTFCTNTKRT